MRKPITYGQISKEESKQADTHNIADNQRPQDNIKPNKVPRKKLQIASDIKKNPFIYCYWASRKRKDTKKFNNY